MTDPQGTISYNYDQLNRLTWTTVYGDKTIHYGYDANSNRSSMTSPDFGTVQYPAYDEMNRLKEIVDPQNGVTTYSYDPGGRLEEMVYPNWFAIKCINCAKKITLVPKGNIVSDYDVALRWSAAGG